MFPDLDGPEILDGDEEGSLVALPSFQGGGRVDRTGIALVHEGEYIVPAEGSEAVITPGAEGGSAGQVINYYFPVEVEIVGQLSEPEVERIAQAVFDELETALRNLV
jgi:hypothetical protein